MIKGTRLILMGAINLAAVTSIAFADEQPFRPVALQCPATKNSGVFELISQNRSGERQKITAHFQEIGGKPKIQAIEISIMHDSQGSWEPDFSINLWNENSDKDNVTADKALKIIAAVWLKVCNGTTDQKTRFEQQLHENAKQ